MLQSIIRNKRKKRGSSIKSKRKKSNSSKRKKSLNKIFSHMKIYDGPLNLSAISMKNPL